MKIFLALLTATIIAVPAFAQDVAPSYPSPPANPQAYQAPTQSYSAPRYTPQAYQTPPSYQQAPRGYYPPPQSYRRPPAQYQAPRQAPQYGNARPAYPQQYAPRPYPPRGYYPRKRKKKSRFGFGKFNPSNPKKSMSNIWDDGWKEPGNWGKMPGGWTFPDISLPNPVDSADDFQKGIKDIPKGFNQD